MSNEVRILDAFPARAFFRPGEPLAIVAEISASEPVAVRLRIELTHLVERVRITERVMRLPRGRARAVVEVPLPRESGRGYGITVSLLDRGGRVRGSRATACDVLRAWWEAPRYGFLTDFAPGSHDTVETRADWCLRLHLNALQFYDWMWRHDTLLSPAEVFVDPLGRRLSASAIGSLASAARERGMSALAYLAVCGASPEFGARHPAWRLYREDGTPYRLGGLLDITDPGNASWQRHLLTEVTRAFRRYRFDGLHLDQYGFPIVARTAVGELVAVGPRIARFAARAAREAGAVACNAVNGWPLEELARVPLRTHYVEVWPPHDRYRDLRQLVRRARAANGERGVVLVPYQSALRGPRVAAGALASLGLTMQAVFASGAYPFLHGEDRGVLADPYFPRFGTLSPAAARRVRDLADFAVRVGELLSGDGEDVSDLVSDGPSPLIGADAPLSADGRPATVWTQVRRWDGTLAALTVDLRGERDDRWQRSKRGRTRPLRLRVRNGQPLWHVDLSLRRVTYVGGRASH